MANLKLSLVGGPPGPAADALVGFLALFTATLAYSQTTPILINV